MSAMSSDVHKADCPGNLGTLLAIMRVKHVSAHIRLLHRLMGDRRAAWHSAHPQGAAGGLTSKLSVASGGILGGEP